MAAWVHAVVLAACVCAGWASESTLWPVPTGFKSHPSTNPPRQLATGFKITGNLPATYQNLYNGILNGVATAPAPSSFTEISVVVAQNTSALTPETDYSYKLVVTNSSTISITAPTQFGGLYALDTAAQLFDNGGIASSFIEINDTPENAHRALMLDVADRFVPVNTLMTIIDGLLYSKMNVLSLHFAWGTNYRLPSAVFPKLPSATAYTADDITNLVAYARDRGVLIVPQIAIPANASYLVNADASFCDAAKTIINKSELSNAAVATVFNETVKYFGGPARFFIGGDNYTAGTCSADTFKEVVNIAVIYLSNIVPAIEYIGGWFSFAQALPAADPKFHIFTRSTAELTAAGKAWSVVYSGEGSNYYLSSDANGNQYVPPSAIQSSLYVDLPTLSKTTKIIGSNVMLATRNFVPIVNDSIFNSTIQQVIFPRASVAGAAAWNYEAVANFDAFLGAFTARLAARGINSCAAGCACSESSVTCASSSSDDIETLQFGMIMAIVIFVVFLLIIVVALVRSSGHRSGYSQVN